MNLEESNAFIEENERQKKLKRFLLISIFGCGLLLVLLIGLIIMAIHQDSLKLKMYINGNKIKMSDTLLRKENNETYVNIKEFSQMIGYSYINGEYKKYNEDEKSCYLQNNFEIVAFKANSDNFKKYINYPENTSDKLTIGQIEVTIKSNNGDSETYSLKNPILFLDNSLYMPFDILAQTFNIRVDTSTENRIRISTLDVLTVEVQNVLARLGYTSMSGNYENLRALVDQIAIVGRDNLYGAISLKDGRELISVKYKDITYIQNTKEFLVSADNTVGLLGSKGNTIIEPTEYDNIYVLDELNKLYVVQKDNKYGVLDREGKVVIYAEYDKIGYKNIDRFSIDELRNKNLLFDECIPIEKEGKYGLFDIKGEELLLPVYNGFGYERRSSDKNGEESVLIIPPSVGIKGIVVNYDKGYGIYDINKRELIIPCVCTRVYYKTKSGKTSYYVEFNGEQIELENYIKVNNLQSVSDEEKSGKKINDNELIDENSNTVDTNTSSNQNSTDNSDVNGVSNENTVNNNVSEEDIEEEN